MLRTKPSSISNIHAQRTAAFRRPLHSKAFTAFSVWSSLRIGRCRRLGGKSHRHISSGLMD